MENFITLGDCPRKGATFTKSCKESATLASSQKGISLGKFTKPVQKYLDVHLTKGSSALFGGHINGIKEVVGKDRDRPGRRRNAGEISGSDPVREDIA